MFFFLTDGSVSTWRDSFTHTENQYDTKESPAFDIVENERIEELLESKESIELEESVESEESEQLVGSEESIESEKSVESEETNSPILSQNLPLIKTSKIFPSSSVLLLWTPEGTKLWRPISQNF